MTARAQQDPRPLDRYASVARSETRGDTTESVPHDLHAGSESQASEIPQETKVRPSSWRVATNLIKSFQYAGMGLGYAFRTQRNFRIHTALAVFAIGLGVMLRLSGVELALICLTCGLVMAMELVNTALEAAVDLAVGSHYHLLAKIAKDCGAAAVLVTALVAVGVAGLVLAPPLWQLLNQ